MDANADRAPARDMALLGQFSTGGGGGLPDLARRLINEATPDQSGVFYYKGGLVCYEGFDESLCWPDVREKLASGRYADIAQVEAEMKESFARRLAQKGITSPELVYSGWRGEGEVGVGDVFYAVYTHSSTGGYFEV